MHSIYSHKALYMLTHTPRSSARSYRPQSASCFAQCLDSLYLTWQAQNEERVGVYDNQMPYRCSCLEPTGQSEYVRRSLILILSLHIGVWIWVWVCTSEFECESDSACESIIEWPYTLLPGIEGCKCASIYMNSIQSLNGKHSTREVLLRCPRWPLLGKCSLTKGT